MPPPEVRRAEARDQIDRWRASPAGTFALRMYAEHRAPYQKSAPTENRNTGFVPSSGNAQSNRIGPIGDRQIRPKPARRTRGAGTGPREDAAVIEEADRGDSELWNQRELELAARAVLDSCRRCSVRSRRAGSRARCLDRVRNNRSESGTPPGSLLDTVEIRPPRWKMNGPAGCARCPSCRSASCECRSRAADPRPRSPCRADMPFLGSTG